MPTCSILAVAQDDDVVGQRHRFGLIVGDIDHRRADVLVKLGDLDAHRDAEFGIEVGERLVEQEDLGRAHDGAPDGDALALATGELGGLALEQLLHLERARSGCDLLGDLLLAEAGHLQREADVLLDGHVRVEGVVLEDHRHAALDGVGVVDATTADADLAVGDRL